VEREPDAFECIGSETREVLERRPAAVVAVKLVYKKFARKTGSVVARPGAGRRRVELPIERGSAGRFSGRHHRAALAGPSAAQSAGSGLRARWPGPSRSTLCTWHGELGGLARPLHEAMFIDALGSPYLCVDATGVLVLAKERCHNGHFWVLVAPDRHVLFRYSESHDGAGRQTVTRVPRTSGRGRTHRVRPPVKTGNVVEVGCWAHARRYWWKALVSDPERANIAWCTSARSSALSGQLPVRPAKRARGAAGEIKADCGSLLFLVRGGAGRVLDESPVADAIRYAVNQKAR